MERSSGERRGTRVATTLRVLDQVGIEVTPSLFAYQLLFELQQVDDDA